MKRGPLLTLRCGPCPGIPSSCSFFMGMALSLRWGSDTSQLPTALVFLAACPSSGFPHRFQDPLSSLPIRCPGRCSEVPRTHSHGRFSLMLLVSWDWGHPFPLLPPGPEQTPDLLHGAPRAERGRSQRMCLHFTQHPPAPGLQTACHFFGGHVTSW